MSKTTQKFIIAAALALAFVAGAAVPAAAQKASDPAFKVKL